MPLHKFCLFRAQQVVPLLNEAEMLMPSIGLREALQLNHRGIMMEGYSPYVGLPVDAKLHGLANVTVEIWDFLVSFHHVK